MPRLIAISFPLALSMASVLSFAVWRGRANDANALLREHRTNLSEPGQYGIYGNRLTAEVGAIREYLTAAQLLAVASLLGTAVLFAKTLGDGKGWLVVGSFVTALLALALAFLAPS